MGISILQKAVLYYFP